VDPVDHEDPSGRSGSRGFLGVASRGREAWRASRTRGRLTRPRGLTSASDLTRNSPPLAWLVSPAFLFQSFPLSRKVRGSRARWSESLSLFLSSVSFFIVLPPRWILLADQAEYSEEKGPETRDFVEAPRVAASLREAAESGERARASADLLCRPLRKVQFECFHARDTMCPRYVSSGGEASLPAVTTQSLVFAFFRALRLRELRPRLGVKRGTPSDYPAHQVLQNFRFRVKRTVVHRSGPHLAAGLFSAASFFSLAASRR